MIDKEKLWKEMEEFALIDQIEVTNIPNNPSILDDLKKDFPNLTVELIHEVINDHKSSAPSSPLKDDKKPDKKPKKPDKKSAETEVTKASDIISSDIIPVYSPKPQELINTLTPTPRKIEGVIDNAIQSNQLTTLDAIPLEFFNTLLVNAEKMITPAHFKNIEHKSDSSPEKFSPYLGCLIAKDLLCTMRNIQVSVDTKFVAIPKLDDVLVICTCTIRDSNRNVIIDGIIATQYLLKKRVIDESDMETDVSYGDKGTVEKCGTNAIRRAIEYIIPPFIMQDLTKIAERKYNEALKLKEGQNLKPTAPIMPAPRRRG